MGAFDKQKKEIKRDLKRQRTDLGKAKKLAEALFNQLQGVEGRLFQTEETLDSLPGTEIDTAFKLLRDKKDSPQVKETLQQIAERLMAVPPTRSMGLKTSMKPGRRTVVVRRQTIVTARRGRPPVLAGKLASKMGSKIPTKGSRGTKISKVASNKSSVKSARKPIPSVTATSAPPSIGSVQQRPTEEDDEDTSNDGAEDMEED